MKFIISSLIAVWCLFFIPMYTIATHKARQRKSDKGKTFPGVHQQIMNLKGWLRGIHHKCSQKHYQKYLDEYCFRTNRRNIEQGIFRAIMLRGTIENKNIQRAYCLCGLN